MSWRLLADMGISHRVQTWLTHQGHDVVHLRDLGLHRMADEDILAKAATEDRIILTFDLDFGELLAKARGRRVGVILFRLNDTTTPFVIQRLQSLINEVSEAVESGAIVVVEDARFRIRRTFDALDSA